MGDLKNIATCPICMELCKDARTLTCSHYFCLDCIKSIRSRSNNPCCPLCRERTIPATHQLESLQKNRAINDMVDVLRRNGEDSDEEQQDPNAMEATESPSTSQHTPVQEETPSLRTPVQEEAAGIAVQEQTFVAATEPQNMPAANPALGDINDGRRMEGLDLVIHRGIRCDHCGRVDFDGVRYKCGICEDFDLCERCEAREPHQPHVLIKITKMLTEHIARRVLREEAELMGQSMSYEHDDVHRLYLPNANNEAILCNIYCERCNNAPITGIRFKCGVCDDYDLCQDCERTSGEFHNEDHFFLVFRHPVSVHTTIRQIIYDLH